jgi:DNA modification methylase
MGDCRAVLKTLPDKSVHCCITSPPYFGLRDYGVDGQIGLEQTPEEYVNELVSVFREVRRVLRDDGTLWLNLGDSYAGNRKAGNKLFGNPVFNENRPSREETKTPEKTIQCGLKNKDLIGIPWKVAFALQKDGWILRSDIIWAKNNPMPESVTDRPTKAHEYIFLLAKSQKYYFDNESIKEDGAEPRKSGKMIERGPKEERGAAWHYRQGATGFGTNGKRNKRSVWNINTKPYKGAHFATFPPELIEPCILAGCPENGTVLDPFGGSGTVCQVCNQFGRDAILIELNPEYKHLIEERINAKPTIKKPSKKRKDATHLSKVALQQNLLHYIN